MFAVIRTGGKQYKVVKDDVIAVEKLEGDEGADVVFNDVLVLGDKVGAPLIDGAAVAGKVVRQARGDKITVFKKKRRQNYRRTRGHRQELTFVQITDLEGKAKAAPKKATAAKKDDASSETKASEAKTTESKKAEPAKKPAAKKPAAKKASASKSAAKPKAKAAPKKAAAKKDDKE